MTRWTRWQFVLAALGIGGMLCGQTPCITHEIELAHDTTMQWPDQPTRIFLHGHRVIFKRGPNIEVWQCVGGHIRIDTYSDLLITRMVSKFVGVLAFIGPHITAETDSTQ